VKPVLVLLAAAAIWSTAAPVSAQVIRTRPFPGIFGSGDPAKSVTQVDFLSFIGGGYESATLTVGDDQAGSGSDDRGFGNLVLRGRVAHQGRRTTFGAETRATTAYYTGRGARSPFSMSAGANFRGAVGRHGTFALRQTVFYSPYYVLSSLTPEEADEEPETVPDADDSEVDPRVDLRTTRLSTKGYVSSAYTGRKVGRNGSLFAAYRLAYIDFAPGAFDALAQAPRAGYRHRIGRFASFIASYGVQMYEYRASPYDRLTAQNVALGVSYDRPLSAWRRTTVGFNMSTAFLGNESFGHVRLNGNARIHRRFGRTWLAGLTYLRGQQVFEGFTAPFFTFSDAAAFTFSGRLVRDIRLSGRALYSHSRYSLGQLENSFNRTSGSLRVQVPVMWALAAYVEGYYAEHEFQRRLGLLEGVPTSLERLGTRVGLTVSVPVLR
jgi:hypothetical protein